MKADSPFPFLVLLALAGCAEPVEPDVAGKLVQVQVTTTFSDCLPARFTGDAGVQFFGERADGGVVFTMSQQAVYGPTVDGGVLEGVQRQLIPSPNGGQGTALEGVSGCEGSFSAWTRTDTGVMVTQQWPGGNTCPAGPIWLPRKSCTTTRVYAFTEVGTCQLSCVRISNASGEVDCGC